MTPTTQLDAFISTAQRLRDSTAGFYPLPAQETNPIPGHYHSLLVLDFPMPSDLRSQLLASGIPSKIAVKIEEAYLKAATKFRSDMLDADTQFIEEFSQLPHSQGPRTNDEIITKTRVVCQTTYLAQLKRLEKQALHFGRQWISRRHFSTPFPEDTVRILEAAYSRRQVNLNSKEKAFIAGKAGITERQVLVWFQNRRQRGLRRASTDMSMVSFGRVPQKDDQRMSGSSAQRSQWGPPAYLNDSRSDVATPDATRAGSNGLHSGRHLLLPSSSPAPGDNVFEDWPQHMPLSADVRFGDHYIDFNTWNPQRPSGQSEILLHTRNASGSSTNTQFTDADAMHQQPVRIGHGSIPSLMFTDISLTSDASLNAFADDEENTEGDAWNMGDYFGAELNQDLPELFDALGEEHFSFADVGQPFEAALDAAVTSIEQTHLDTLFDELIEPDPATATIQHTPHIFAEEWSAHNDLEEAFDINAPVTNPLPLTGLAPVFNGHRHILPPGGRGSPFAHSRMPSPAGSMTPRGATPRLDGSKLGRSNTPTSVDVQLPKGVSASPIRPPSREPRYPSSWLRKILN